MNRKPNLPPGPRGHFLSGSLPEIQADRVQFLMDLSRDYGSIAHIHVGPFEAVVVFHPDGIQHVLQDNHQNYSKQTRTYDSLRSAVGNGLIVSDGSFWLRQRRLMAPAFHHSRIEALAGLFCEEANLALERLSAVYSPGEEVNISHELMRLTLAIVTRSLFNRRISDDNSQIFSALSIILNDPPFRFENPLYPPLSIPTGYNRRYRAARASIDKIIYELIAERRANPQSGGDLLAMLMDAVDAEGAQMTDLQLRDEIFTLILGGHESSALALGWMLYLLSQHPEVQVRLREEVRQVLGERTPTLQDLPRMPYTRMVIDETIRFYPPGWLFERRAIADDEILGYHIPAGMNLAFSPYVTHRLPEFWENPERFDPDHFSPGLVESRPRFAYLPFGGGPRQCIGNSFALQELQLILPMLLQRFRFEQIPGAQPRLEPVVSLRPKGGLKMRLYPL